MKHTHPKWYNPLLVVLGSIFIAGIGFAFAQPTEPPPGGNLPTPITESGVNQEKVGGLTLGQLCLGGDCITSFDDIASPWTQAANGNVYRATGNVGIAQTNPTSRLDVNGDVKATGFCLGSSCKSTSVGWVDVEVFTRTLATPYWGGGTVSVSCPSGWKLISCSGYFDGYGHPNGDFGGVQKSSATGCAAYYLAAGYGNAVVYAFCGR